MRFRKVPLFTTYVIILYRQLVDSVQIHFTGTSQFTNPPRLHSIVKRSDSFNTTVILETTTPDVRQKRQTANPDFSWKVTKTPKFITAKTEKHPEPILRVYPPDVVFRSGRSRELTVPQRNGARRVIYYATLPEVVRYPPNPSLGAGQIADRYTNYIPTNQQRSYNPNKGSEFVTRVQSSIIDVRPRGDKKEINSTPTFTIIDANPTPNSNPAPYAQYQYNRIRPEYNQIVVDKPSYIHIPTYYDQGHYQMPYPSIKPQAQYPPYYGNLEKNRFHVAHYQYHQQTAPYYYNEMGKIPSPYFSPPYPSRHTRFPSDRYPLDSPLSQLNIGLPTSSPLTPTSLDYNSNFHSFQPNYLNDGPPTLSSLSTGQDLNNDLPSLDHSLDLEDHHPVSPINNKFSDLGSYFSTGSPLSQKYLDLHGYNPEYPFKFDKEPFKGTFSQVSDWLTNKPFDLSSLDLDDVTNNRDYQIKGSSHSVIIDSQMVNKNLTTTVKDSNNTVITPLSPPSVTENPEEKHS